MDRKVIVAGAFVALAACVPALAQKTCSKADAAKAEKAVDMVSDFKQLAKAWGDWKQCDEGTVADVFTDSLFRLLVDWKGVDALASTMQANTDYADWVTRRIKYAPKDDRNAVYSRAKTGCPAKLDGFCTTLADAAADIR